MGVGCFAFGSYIQWVSRPLFHSKMKVEIEITKTDLDTIRKRMGLKTKTKGEAVLQSLVKTVVDDEYSLTYNRW